MDPKTMEASLELDGRLVIDAKVLPHRLLHMVGQYTVSHAMYPGGKVEYLTKQAQWALRQRNNGSNSTWCSPFQGLFEAMRHALEAGSTLTTSLQIEGAESEAMTAQGLHSGHEYSVQGAVQVVSTEGQMEKLITLQNPWLKGEWTGPRGDSDIGWWTPERRRQARMPDLNDNESGTNDDGLFAMPYNDYIANFTRLDISNTFLPSAINGSDQSPSDAFSCIQLLGMITHQCGGATHWWRNPRFMVQLQEHTNLTITLNEPNTKTVGLPREQFDVEMGFRVVMDVVFPPNSVRSNEVLVDHGDPKLRHVSAPTATGAPCILIRLMHKDPQFIDRNTAHAYPELTPLG